MGTVLMMKKVNNKLKRLGAGEMAQHLTALTEDLSLVPRMHTRGAYNRLELPLLPSKGPEVTCTHLQNTPARLLLSTQAS